MTRDCHDTDENACYKQLVSNPGEFDGGQHIYWTPGWDQDSEAIMSTLVGKINEFDWSKEEWPQYVKGMDHFFTANGIDAADRKKSTFLAVIGPTYPYTAKESRVAKQARR